MSLTLIQKPDYVNYLKYREALEAMGTPKNVPFSEEGIKAIGDGLEWFDEPSFYPVHPMFSATEYFYPESDGYHGRNTNPFGVYCRGQYQATPLISEYENEIYFLCTEFHKGNTRVTITYFPERTEAARDRLFELLSNKDQ